MKDAAERRVAADERRGENGRRSQLNAVFCGRWGGVGSAAMLTAVLSLVLTAASSSVSQPWPGVRPFDRLFRVTDPSRVVLKATLEGSNGSPLYLFVCRTADDESVPGVIYAGDLDCHLMPAAQGEVEENLLVEQEGLAAWYSRARMFVYELSGDCAAYPEYGRIRHFDLRAMHITLSFENVAFSPGGRLSAYDMRLRVEPNARAMSSIAASSGYLNPHRKVPGRSCSTIQRDEEWAPR